MNILIDNGRIRGAAAGLGQVSLQFAAALMRTRQPTTEDRPDSARKNEMQFQFLAHPQFAEFAAQAATIGATLVQPQFSPWNKLRRIFDKNVYAYSYDGAVHNVRHALHRQHLEIPARDKTPFVLTVHDMHILSGGARSRARNLRRMKESIARADVVAFISQYARDVTAEHIDLSGKETAIIYNGVDKPRNPRRPQWFKDEMRPFLFSVAQIAAHKNYHILPPMMRRLPGVNLIVAGKYKDGASLLRDAIRREKTGDRIVVPGAIGESEKAFLLRECAGFVFPSLREGFGMPIVEAMHFGKAVFCFRSTALPEVGGGCALYWQSDDPKEMAELILQNIAAPAASAPESAGGDMAAARKKRAAEFSWDQNAAAYIDIYRRLAAR